MIHKVYIVRCSYCHSPLKDRYASDHRPAYFYQLDSIPATMNEAGWKTINGMQVCQKCVQTSIPSEL